jgi:hypothetical protein
MVANPDWYYQSGEGLNLLARAAAVKVPSIIAGTIDPQFPVANLYDGRPSKYTRWSTVGAWAGVAFDLNLLAGGDGEDATALATWTVTQDYGTGSVTQNASGPYSGTYSIRLYNSGMPAGAHWVNAAKELRFRAGEKLRVYHAGLKVTSNTTVVLTLQNLETGYYLQPDGSWNTFAGFAAHVGSNYTDGYIDFAIPGFESGGAAWQRLRLIISAGTSSGTSIDTRAEVKIVPGWDTIVALGHTFTPIPAGNLVFAYQTLSGNNPGDTFSGSTDYPPAWLKTTNGVAYPFPDGELYQAGVWNKALLTRYERWVAFYVSQAGGPVAPTTQLGELILCQAETLPRRPRLQLTVAPEAAGQIRVESGAGDLWAYNRTPIPRNKLTLRYQTTSRMDTGDDAAARAARYLHVLRTHGGAKPTLVLPYTHDQGLVVYGHAATSISIDHQPPERNFEVEITDLPIPGLHHGIFA